MKLVAAVLCGLLLLAYSEEQNSTQLTSKIIGGQTLSPELYPYVIKFKFIPTRTSTAVLISRSLIMTTASSIQGLGKLDLNASYVEIPNIFIREGNIFYIQEILIDGFDKNLPVPLGDFAVLRLREDVPPNVPFISISREIPPNNCPVTVIGWCTSRRRHNDVQPMISHRELKKLSVKITSNLRCGLQLGLRILDSQMCVVSGNGPDNNICSGDSGVPLIYNGVLIGIASCYSRNYPSIAIFTRISFYYQFIMREIRDESDTETDAESIWSVDESSSCSND